MTGDWGLGSGRRKRIYASGFSHTSQCPMTAVASSRALPAQRTGSPMPNAHS
ncbi:MULTISPECIES: hypothetical protein [Nostoc]|uniref:Uncharacterized protein n=1 Tax=Nostoc paludosum FACHB-159 TaxID=2692908 RepID=A0ABR8K672_9NOSO|nr:MULTISPECIES: hypothetical protein [Nostoc]MBD2676800.1 hypothetical protein [Nostoc sp. FACHB-857]MBD2734987.1 hypothetical protein [Nostoc paludosum FACHB-159]